MPLTWIRGFDLNIGLAGKKKSKSGAPGHVQILPKMDFFSFFDFLTNFDHWHCQKPPKWNGWPPNESSGTPKLAIWTPGALLGGPPTVDFASFSAFSDPHCLSCLGLPPGWIPTPQTRVLGPRGRPCGPWGHPWGPTKVDSAMLLPTYVTMPHILSSQCFMRWFT